ncbi:MAG: molecular chaperone DnaJ [Patescibacteria group bacterium]|nr:molecular chaperone DnaJ [Patescibacteria group bacterium]
MPKDYYEALGVSREADEAEIKKAYRRLAHKYHPDKKGGDVEKFKEINEAYQTLSNKDKRSQYDQFGHSASGGDPGGFSGFQGMNNGGGFEFNFGEGGFGDVFGDLFSNFKEKGFGAERGAERGTDVGVDVEILFKEMAEGVTKEIEIYKGVVCDKCKGSGAESGSKFKKCDECGGTGQIQTERRTILGSFAQTSVCDKCGGKGEIPEKQCSKCSGEGKVKESVKIEVAIPAGIKDGQTISMEGEGEPGERGSSAGDLYITVHVKPDPQFERRGDDVWHVAKIPFSMATLGGKIEIITLSGKMKMKIPVGTQNGKVFKLKGEGVKRLQGYGRGDEMVKIKVNVPRRLNRKQKKMVKELAENGL